MAKVAIIGGGPGGLALATQIRAFTKKRADVVIYEKYPSYQRHHVLQLKRGSFGEFPKTAAIQEVVNGFFQRGENREPKALRFIKSLFPEKANVKTSEIERSFKQLADDSGIQFVYGAIDDPDQIAKENPEVSIVVGAEGFHSEMRKQKFTQKMYLHVNELQLVLEQLQQKEATLTLESLRKVAIDSGVQIVANDHPNLESTKELFKGVQERHSQMSLQEFMPLLLKRLSHELVPNQADLQYVAELKYEVKGSNAQEKHLIQGYFTQQDHETVVNQFVGREQNGVTPITLRAFIDKESFLALQDKATFKHPLTLESDAVPPHLKALFTSWLKMRHETELAQNVKLTVTKLQVYKSDEVVKKVDGRTYCLVSDAAAGVPFFESYNSIGLPETSILAKAIATELDLLDEEFAPHFPKELRVDFQYYSQFHRHTSQKAIDVAHFKNGTINAYKEWLKLSHKNKMGMKAMADIGLIKELVDRILATSEPLEVQET